MSAREDPRSSYFASVRERLAFGDPQYRILYKYQSFRPYTCDSLRNNVIKYSRHADLNDAFDLGVRFPDPFAPTYGDIWRLRDLVKPLAGQGYNVPDTVDELARYMSQRKLRPLEALAI